MDAMTDREYVENRGLFCPICRSTNINASAIEDEGEEGHTDCNCADCGAMWGEWYTLDRYAGLMDKDGVPIEIPTGDDT